MTVYGWELDKLVKEKDWVPFKLPRYAEHVVGRTYWCSYWLKWYKVLDKRGRQVTVRWQDGKVTTHCTSLAPGDYELRKSKNTKLEVGKMYHFAEIVAMQLKTKDARVPALVRKYGQKYRPVDTKKYVLKENNCGRLYLVNADKVGGKQCTNR